jgi:hypothetical protein
MSFKNFIFNYIVFQNCLIENFVTIVLNINSTLHLEYELEMEKVTPSGYFMGPM